MTDTPPSGRVPASNYVGWRAQGGWRPLTVTRADASTFWDSEGRSYLDFASQLVASNLGHANPAVVQAIHRQVGVLPYISPAFSTKPREALSALLDDVLPTGLRRYFFGSTGTEANETALAIARLVTGRTKVVSRPRSYHGATAAALSVSGDLRHLPMASVQAVPGTVFAPDCYCYRCPLQLTYPECGVACADEVDRIIEREGDVAAMIVEPVVGTNGVIPPVPEYLPKVREITRRHGALLIADEVMTGWCRTGAWFAVDHWKVEPDILTTAKGLTGAYVPLSLTATTVELHERFRDRFFPQGHTYEAHPTGAAAAVAAIGEYRRLDAAVRARREGDHLLERLRAIAPRHPSVGDVRGLGLFAAVELVHDRTTRAPFNTEDDKLAGRPLVADEVASEMMREGVYALSWVSHLVLAPPLVVTRAEIDRGVEVLDRALALADARVQ